MSLTQLGGRASRKKWPGWRFSWPRMRPRSSPGRSLWSTAAASCAAIDGSGTEASMALRLACSDYTFPLLAHEHVFKLISALGFEGVDVGLFEDRSHLQPSHVLPHLARSANALSQQVP